MIDHNSLNVMKRNSAFFLCERPTQSVHKTSRYFFIAGKSDSKKFEFIFSAY